MRFVPLAVLTLLVTFAPGSGAQPGLDTPFSLYAAPQQRIQIGAGRYIHIVCMAREVQP